MCVKTLRVQANSDIFSNLEWISCSFHYKDTVVIFPSQNDTIDVTKNYSYPAYSSEAIASRSTNKQQKTKDKNYKDLSNQWVYI